MSLSDNIATNLNFSHIYSDICNKSLIYRESRLGLVTEVSDLLLRFVYAAMTRWSKVLKKQGEEYCDNKKRKLRAKKKRIKHQGFPKQISPRTKATQQQKHQQKSTWQFKTQHYWIRHSKWHMHSWIVHHKHWPPAAMSLRKNNVLENKR